MKYFRFLPLMIILCCVYTITAQTSSPAIAPAQGEIRVNQVKHKLGEGALMIDVREQSEVDMVAFDVEDILHVPMSDLQARLGDIPRDRTLVIACQSGVRSRRVSTVLRNEGFTDVLNMTGGMKAWLERGLGVVK